MSRNNTNGGQGREQMPHLQGDRNPELTTQAMSLPINSRRFSSCEWKVIQCAYRLTERQLDMARGILDHSKYSVVAENLNISLATVRTHVRALYHKLSVNSQSELALRLQNAIDTSRRSQNGSLKPLCWNRENGRCPNHPLKHEVSNLRDALASP